MPHFNRRKFLQSTSAAAGAAAGPMIWTKDAQAQWSNTPEKGAQLRVLRWKRFVQGDEDVYMANVKKFEEKTGIKVRVDHEGWEDVRPKAAVAANVGSGPDIILGTNDDANLYPEKLVDCTDVELTQTGKDRVEVRGGRARPRTPTYKVVVGHFDGYIGEAEVSYGGIDAVARAKIAAEIEETRAKFGAGPLGARRSVFAAAPAVAEGATDRSTPTHTRRWSVAPTSTVRVTRHEN